MPNFDFLLKCRIFEVIDESLLSVILMEYSNIVAHYYNKFNDFLAVFFYFKVRFSIRQTVFFVLLYFECNVQMALMMIFHKTILIKIMLNVTVLYYYKKHRSC
jgi:hypothetical protein